MPEFREELLTMCLEFAKEYAEFITFIYYCVTSLIAAAAFIVGTWYLNNRDRRDQRRREKEERHYQERRQREDRAYQERRQQGDREYQKRRQQEDREYQERRQQEDREHQDRRRQEDRENQDRRDQEDRRDHLRREWRQFAERIYTDYSKLKSKDIPQKISKLKNTFEPILIHSEVTGLDVLRYMLTDDNCHNFASESPLLEALREDLHAIFVPLTVCSSLLLLGEVPVNIKEELRFMVEELGNVAEPFLTGEQQGVALKCMKNFGSNRSSSEHGQRRAEELCERIKDIVLYVNNLHLTPGMRTFRDDRDYSKCETFSFKSDITFILNRNKNLQVLLGLEKCLTCRKHSIGIFREKPAELPVKSIERINDIDSDEVILMKVLHEVRLYLQFILYENENLSREDNERVERNIKRLKQLYKRLTEKEEI